MVQYRKIMKRSILVLLAIIIWVNVSAQFVATMEVKEDIPGLCNRDQVFVLLSAFKGQQEAVCPVSNEDILKRLNSEVTFLKDNPEFNDKGIISLIINCKGEVVQCRMDNKTKNPGLDKQIETVFNSLGKWTPGKLKKRAVDTCRLFGFNIVNGVFTFDR
jgi:hypothetical protein